MVGTLESKSTGWGVNNFSLVFNIYILVRKNKWVLPSVEKLYQVLFYQSLFKGYSWNSLLQKTNQTKVCNPKTITRLLIPILRVTVNIQKYLSAFNPISKTCECTNCCTSLQHCYWETTFQTTFMTLSPLIPPSVSFPFYLSLSWSSLGLCNRCFCSLIPS